MNRKCAFLSLTLLPQLAAGGVWVGCQKTDNIFMSFPEPHGKAWPTQFSVADFWGDTTKFQGVELDVYVRVCAPLNRPKPCDVCTWLKGRRSIHLAFLMLYAPSPPFPVTVTFSFLATPRERFTAGNVRLANGQSYGPANLPNWNDYPQYQVRTTPT